MPESTPVGGRRSRNDEVEHGAADGGPPTSKRRAFLRTMGQQLREFGPESTSPQTQQRGSFSMSPNNHGPSSTASNNHASILRPRNGGTTIPTDTPESDAAPGESDLLPPGTSRVSSKWLWRQNEVLSLDHVTAHHVCTFQDLLDWSQSYFDHWHPAFPFLHAPSLLDYFRQVSQKDAVVPDAYDFQYVLLRAVISISLVDSRQMVIANPLVPPSLVFHSFDDAMSSIQPVLVEETSILSLQALVSVQLFLISMLRYNSASRLEGIAVRMAYQLRLHRCPVLLGGDAAKQAELRKRLFWSIFCIDRYICIRLGIPLGIRTQDTDVCYPHAERHARVNEHNERDHRLDLLDMLARHAGIRGSVMELRNQSALGKSHDEADATLSVEAEHTRWWNHVDEYLSENERTLKIAKPHQVTLIILRFESVIALHRSTLAISKRDSAYNAALQRCVSASRSIINTLHKAMQGFGAFDGSPGQSGYQRIPLLWPSFTWAVWMSTFVLIFAASENQVPQDVALRLANRSVEILRHLALRGTNWPETCIIAIENLSARLQDRSRQSSRNSTVEPWRAQDDQAGRLRPAGSGGFAVTTDAPLGSTMAFALPTARSAETPYPTSLGTVPTTNLGVSTYTGSSEGTAFHPSLSSAYLNETGTFLGIAQQLSDNPAPTHDIMNLFNGEDMGFWAGADFGCGPGG